MSFYIARRFLCVRQENGYIQSGDNQRSFVSTLLVRRLDISEIYMTVPKNHLPNKNGACRVIAAQDRHQVLTEYNSGIGKLIIVQSRNLYNKIISHLYKDCNSKTGKILNVGGVSGFEKNETLPTLREAWGIILLTRGRGRDGRKRRFLGGCEANSSFRPSTGARVCAIHYMPRGCRHYSSGKRMCAYAREKERISPSGR